MSTIGAQIEGMRERLVLKEKQGDRNLLQIVLDLHMTTTGALERSTKEQTEDAKLLFESLTVWDKPVHSPVFDSLVFALCSEVLREHWVKWDEARGIMEMLPLSTQIKMADQEQLLQWAALKSDPGLAAGAEDELARRSKDLNEVVIY